MTEVTFEVALLAPVPLAHIESAIEVCEKEGRVAFASNHFELFPKLDSIREGSFVDVYIYASFSNEDIGPQVSWVARYTGHVESIEGTHPDGMRFRPPSTSSWEGDNEGFWAVFWEVDQIRRLSPEEYIPIGKFSGFGKSKPYLRNFVPEGPILVNHL